jgi:hypothetical protein
MKNCVQALLKEVLSEVLGFIPGASCIQAGFEAYTALGVAETGLDAVIKKALDSGKDSAMTGGEVIETIGDLIVSCALDLIPQTKLIGVLKDVWDLVQNLEDRIDTINACLPPLPPSKRRTTSVNSRDPNDKVGPDGSGVEGFTTPDVPFDYTIYFENVATATAPAQRVVITDVIDTSTFDPASIELGAIIVGTKIVAIPPAGLREWSGVAEIDDPDLLLGIDVSWTEATSTMTWTLETLDRATQLPTDDPLAGFLPPNVEASEGEGSVRFLIEPRVRTDGTVLTNDATIVFDVNDPIGTGPWTNTLDGTAPASAIAPLAEFARSASIPLSWSASDAVSGVGLVEIWVRRDAGVAELWRIVSDPTVTTDTFVGADGSTYAFWTKAWDRAGNIEPPPGAPDAVTTVRVNRPPTAIGQQVSTEQATDLPIALTGSDPDADALTFEVVTPPANGSLLGTAPNLTYRPAAGFAGADSFTFRVSDGELASTVATIGIDVIPTASADSISLELFGPRRYLNAGDLLTGDLSIRVDRYGIVAVTGSGTIKGVNGGRADFSLQIVRIGRTKLYVGSVRIDDPSVGPIRFTWSGALLGSATSAGPGEVEGIALASSSTRPFGPYVLRWSVFDAGP